MFINKLDKKTLELLNSNIIINEKDKKTFYIADLLDNTIDTNTKYKKWIDAFIDIVCCNTNKIEIIFKSTREFKEINNKLNIFFPCDRIINFPANSVLIMGNIETTKFGTNIIFSEEHRIGSISNISNIFKKVYTRSKYILILENGFERISKQLN